MSVPSLMVLYSTDAVEARYTDGSRLQLSPCGACLLHHDRPRPGTHPLAGLKKIQQRCQYVTSEYRDKVLQALDFRNRFSERPYLCEDLLNKEDVVSLYTDIKEVAWPKTVDKARTEYLPDQSVRIFSSDEFASLSLSPHRRDFTVCYLSKISQELPKNKSISSLRRSTSFKQPHEKNYQKQNRSKDDYDESGKSFPRDETRTNTLSADLENESKSLRADVQSDKCKTGQRYTRISTPTNFADDGAPGKEPVVTPRGYSVAFRRYGASSTDVSPASHEISSISKTSSDGLCTTLDIDMTVGHHDMSMQQRSASPVLPGQTSHGYESRSNSSGQSSRSDRSQIGNSSQESQKSVTNDNDRSPARQFLYTWVTRHVSCCDCPARWSHALKLAVEKADSRLTGTCTETLSDTPGEKLNVPVKVNKKNSVMSPLPLPLPLTCPSQHCHKWAPVDPEEKEDDQFNSGRLKVVMVEGMIYRLIHMSAMKVMELYPGDGTVFVSQGATGQYFSLIVPKQDKLEERTYSVRALPPSLPSAKYALDRMLKRACRLLTEAVQRDKVSQKEGLPCWKIEPVSVSEPMSVSILEEVYIPKVGRFTAHTNGRVRVVFDDRTALDMVCDFSKRIEECAHHSSDLDECTQGEKTNVSKVTALDREIDLDTCRLLLPSGKYILVNKLKPGSYHKYVSQALEWSSWVNASPLERKQFYEKMGQSVNAQGSAALELQKINCFNYILEHTVLGSKTSGEPSMATSSNINSAAPSVQHHGGSHTAQNFGPSITSQFCPIKLQDTSAQSQPISSNPWQSEPIRSSVASYHQPMGNTVLLSNQNIGRHCYHDNPVPQWEPGRTRTMEMLEGFSSVRNALLKTNKLIQDIDHMLDKKS